MFFRYIFPGLALGSALGQTGVVTNAMINRSAEALVELISEDDLKKRATFPEGVDIREISCHLAAKVIMQAMEEGIKVSLATRSFVLPEAWKLSFCRVEIKKLDTSFYSYDVLLFYLTIPGMKCRNLQWYHICIHFAFIEAALPVISSLILKNT